MPTACEDVVEYPRNAWHSPRCFSDHSKPLLQGVGLHFLWTAQAEA